MADGHLVSMKFHYEITVEGKVQGVGYRYFVWWKAKELQIRGFVRNSHEGKVMVEAEGEKTDLDTFVDYLKIGPVMARVRHVDIAQAPYTNNFEDFIIKY
jgi:acylphosphatase